MYRLWCLVQGQPDLFYVDAPSTMLFADLKEVIKEERKILLQGFDSSSLLLMQVRYS
jgi:hypothetical protein